MSIRDDGQALGLRIDGSRVLLSVRVQPRASRTAITGRRAGVLLLAVQSPPVDGAANEAVRRFLAKEILGIPLSAVTLERGESSRDKVIVIVGLAPAEITRRCEPAG